jgi:hypothetical protein
MTLDAASIQTYQSNLLHHPVALAVQVPLTLQTSVILLAPSDSVLHLVLAVLPVQVTAYRLPTL